MKITYGLKDNNIDITNNCLYKLSNNNIITIPSNDVNRSRLFTDPISGVLKKIFILMNDTLFEYDDTVQIKINIIDKTIITINENNNQTHDKLKQIHSNLKIKYGTFNDEFPEQKMSVKYLTGNEKVLEIGGNIGRNSLVIASILKEKNNNQFVTLESNRYVANQLIENRYINKLNFHIENSALSKRKLIQKDNETLACDTLLDGYKLVNTLTLDELHSKYNIIFDTLVLDCEGAFYYILMDMPEILDNIQLIIMENNYFDLSHKNYIDEILIKNNFYRDYVESGGWGPCYNNFFEVWKK